MTRKGVERAVRYAFELARREGRQKVTCATKSNILKLTEEFSVDFLRLQFSDITHPVSQVTDQYVNHPFGYPYIIFHQLQEGLPV